MYTLEKIKKEVAKELKCNPEDLTYPPNSQPKKFSTNLTPLAKHFVPENTNTGSNMTIIVVCPDVPNNSEIVATNENGKVIGCGAVYNEKAAITVWGNNAQTEQIDGAIANEVISLLVFDKEKNEFIDFMLQDMKELLSESSTEKLS